MQYGDIEFKIEKHIINREGTDLHVTTNEGTYLHALAKTRLMVSRNGTEIRMFIRELISKGINERETDLLGRTYDYYIEEATKVAARIGDNEQRSSYRPRSHSHSRRSSTMRFPASLKPDDDQKTIVEKISKYTPQTSP